MLWTEGSTKTLVAGALLVALSGAPSIAAAETNRESPTAAGEARSRQTARPAPVNAAPNVASDYAAREAAAPELRNFAGGGFTAEWTAAGR